MRNVWEELKHNLSGSVLVTLVLIAQFAVFFWQGTLIASYFADTSTESLSLSVQGDYAYYQLAYAIGSEETASAFASQFTDPNFISNAAKAYGELHEDPDLHFITFNGVNAAVNFDEIRERFTEPEIRELHHDAGSLSGSRMEAETVPLENLITPVQNGEWTSGFAPQIYRLDQAAAEHFRLRVSEGRMLEEQDYQFRWDQGSIPVLVGSAYASGFKPGDRIGADLYGIPYQFQVIGILEENTGIITDKYFSERGVPLSLDHAILMPYFNIEESPRNSKEEFLARANYDEAFMGGIVVLDAEAPRSELLRIEKKICDVFLRNGLYPVTTAASPYGVSLFKTESQKTMQILVGASVLMGVMSISGICISVTAKLNRNLHRYGIEIMNGQSTGTILAAFLLEILLIIAAAMGLAVWQFMDMIRYNLVFLWMILGFGLLAAAVTSLVFIRKLRTVDIEEIIRREE